MLMRKSKQKVGERDLVQTFEGFSRKTFGCTNKFFRLRFDALFPFEPNVANHNPGLILFAKLKGCMWMLENFTEINYLFRITSSKMPWSMQPSPKMPR